MRAWEIRAFGVDNLALGERPPLAPGPQQVVVRVRATSLNYRDLMMVRGEYNPRQKLPLVPCSDAAGEVLRVGSGVTRVAVGDRVAPIFAQGWTSGRPTREKLLTTLGGPLEGVLAEEALASEEGLIRLPDWLSDDQGATLPCAAVTAWSALVTQGRIRAGETVLVQGTGGVSLFALAFARMHGARVIVTSSSDAKLARARELGANETINYRTAPDWAAGARKLTSGVGVDHVVEVGGAGTFAQSVRAVRPGGTIHVIGILDGGATQVDLRPILMQNIRLQGVIVGDRESFDAMLAAMTVAQMRPVVDRVFPFEDARAALEHLAAAQHFGKIVIAGA